MQVDVVLRREIGIVDREIEQHHLSLQGGEGNLLTTYHRQFDIRQACYGFGNHTLQQGLLLLLLPAHLQGIHGEPIQVACAFGIGKISVPGGRHCPKHGIILSAVRIKNQEIVDLLKQGIIGCCPCRVGENEFRYLPFVCQKGTIQTVDKSEVINPPPFVLFLQSADRRCCLTHQTVHLPKLVVGRGIIHFERTVEITPFCHHYEGFSRIDRESGYLATQTQLIKLGIRRCRLMKAEAPPLFEQQ